MRLTTFSLFFLPLLFAHAQPAGLDTLYLASGGMLIGEVRNYPPESTIEFYDVNGALTRLPLEAVDAIYPAPQKRLSHSLYIPSPAVATAVSVFVPGLGMIVSGHPRGYLYVGMGALCIGGAIAAGTMNDGLGLFAMSIMTFFLNWGASMIDTPLAVTSLRNDLRRVYPYEFRSFDRQDNPDRYRVNSESLSLSFSVPLH